MIQIILLSLSLISFAIGIYVGLLGYRAYKKDKDKIMLTLCTGFLLIAFSNLFEEFLLNILGFEVIPAHQIRVPLFTLGMIMILYSLKMK